MDIKKFHNRSFCMLESDLIESEAFLNLSGKAALICLMRFHQKAFKKYLNKKKRGLKNLTITNNGEIIFTYSEAKALGIKSADTFNRVLKELSAKGFIDYSEIGNWYAKQPTKFSISYRWRVYGAPDFQKVEKLRILPEGKGFQTKVATIHRSHLTTVDRSDKEIFKLVSIRPAVARN